MRRRSTAEWYNAWSAPHERRYMNVILIEASELDGLGDATIAGDRAAHIVSVLKAGPGATVRVGLLDGPFGLATIATIEDHAVRLRCAFESVVPPRPSVDLLLAVPRPKVLRRLWAQLAALGVARIILTNAERVERNYFDTHVLTPECYRPLLIEGLQQARDTRLPIVSVHRQFRVLVEDQLGELSDASVRLVADPRASASMTGVLRSQMGPRVLLAIGPEGGWNAFELSLLEAHGFRTVSAGSRTLRSDTACIALLSILHGALDS
jgi:RsmE family RNA methyltransferase